MIEKNEMPINSYLIMNSKAKLNKNYHVLDVACGTGAVTKYIQKKHQNQ